MKKTFSKGEPVTVSCTFDGIPDEVFFAYVRPGDRAPTVDPGSNRPGTAIEHEGGGTYRCTVDTAGFPSGGVVHWRMWSEGGCIDSTVDRFTVEGEIHPALQAAASLDATSLRSSALAKALQLYDERDVELRQAALGFALRGREAPSRYAILGGAEWSPESVTKMKYAAIGAVIGILLAIVIGKWR